MKLFLGPQTYVDVVTVSPTCMLQTNQFWQTTVSPNICISFFFCASDQRLKDEGEKYRKENTLTSWHHNCRHSEKETDWFRSLFYDPAKEKSSKTIEKIFFSEESFHSHKSQQPSLCTRVLLLSNLRFFSCSEKTFFYRRAIRCHLV